MRKFGFSLEIEFDDKAAAENFLANWQDGGGDGGGNLDWDTTECNPTYMRVKGTGYAVDYENGKRIVLTPEVEEKKMKEVVRAMEQARLERQKEARTSLGEPKHTSNSKRPKRRSGISKRKDPVQLRNARRSKRSVK